jgi:hypothetical protein
MKTITLKRKFINEMYDGNYTAYLRARKQDYCKVQFEWSCWIDSLCKNGEITQKQYDNITF